MNRNWSLIGVLMLIVFAALPLGAWAQQSGTPSADDWPQTNYDIRMSRNSPQTEITADNVDQLQVKWIFNSEWSIENPPLIVGDRVYAENNAMQIFALNLTTGLPVWQYDVNVPKVGLELPRVSTSHGMTYDNGTLYAPTGPNGTVIALDAETGRLIWESPIIQQGSAWRISAPPIVWNDIVIAGSALGDDPPFGYPAKGSVTGLSARDGSILWQTTTAIGPWVEGPNTTANGGATTWSGGAVDEVKGVIYLPVGNPAPDFTPEGRPEPTTYANSVIAVNITTGEILWSTPFIAQGSVLPNVVIPDTHDWDTAWGTNLVDISTENGTRTMVIGHDKRGDVMAMDPENGTPIWWTAVALQYNVEQQASENGSGEVWPGPGDGVESYTAFDDSTLYAAVSNQGMTYFTNNTVAPVFEAMPNGLGNGSVTAVDLATGEITWTHETPFPTWCSPIVTDDLVFAGHVTASGWPYPYNAFGGATSTPLTQSGLIFALDKNTGEMLWQANAGAQVAVGGPSIGRGYLIVPTGGIQTPNTGGYIVAYGLPSNESVDFSGSTAAFSTQLTPFPTPVPTSAAAAATTSPSATATSAIPTQTTSANVTTTTVAAANATTTAAANATTTAAANATTTGAGGAATTPSAAATTSPSANATTTGTTATTTSTNATGGGGGGTTIDLTAQNIAFDTSTITVPAGAQVTVNFNNMDSGIPHNFAVYTDSSATTTIFKGDIVTGPTTTTYTFTAPSQPGTYFFRCDVHPTMNGQFIVQ